MPTSCYDCPCNKDDGFGFFTCGVTKSECDFIRLPSDCPIVPVPDMTQVDLNVFIEGKVKTFDIPKPMDVDPGVEKESEG